MKRISVWTMTLLALASAGMFTACTSTSSSAYSAPVPAVDPYVDPHDLSIGTPFIRVGNCVEAGRTVRSSVMLSPGMLADSLQSEPQAVAEYQGTRYDLWYYGKQKHHLERFNFCIVVAESQHNIISRVAYMSSAEHSAPSCSGDDALGEELSKLPLGKCRNVGLKMVYDMMVKQRDAAWIPYLVNRMTEPGFSAPSLKNKGWVYLNSMYRRATELAYGKKRPKPAKPVAAPKPAPAPSPLYNPALNPGRTYRDAASIGGSGSSIRTNTLKKKTTCPRCKGEKKVKNAIGWPAPCGSCGGKGYIMK